MTKQSSFNSEIMCLIEGYKQFKYKYFEKSKIYKDLVRKGQKPKVMVIACSDSRVDPAIITNSKPGELFIVRNIANLVPPFEGDHQHHGTSAALEFGVKQLEITDIIVFGHSHCSGINALLETNPDNINSFDFIDDWMDIAKPAKDSVLNDFPNSSKHEKAHICEKKSLLLSLDNLKTFPWINKKVESNNLFLHAWYFNLATGTIELYNSSNDQFILLH